MKRDIPLNDQFQKTVVRFLGISGLVVGVPFIIYHLIWGSALVSLMLTPVMLMLAWAQLNLHRQKVNLLIMRAIGIAMGIAAVLAVYLVLVVVFFQYIFGGAIHNLRDKPIEFQSYIAATRWATLAMGTTVDILEQAEATIVCGNALELDTSGIALDPVSGALDPGSISLVETERPACANRAVAASELFLPYGDSGADLSGFWAAQVALGLVFAAGALLFVKRLDRV